jgi:hypothetical protein
LEAEVVLLETVETLHSTQLHLLVAVVEVRLKVLVVVLVVVLDGSVVLER